MKIQNARSREEIIKLNKSAEKKSNLSRSFRSDNSKLSNKEVKK